MRVTQRTLRLLAAAALVFGLGTGSASAQNLDLDEVGALLALPIVTGTGPTVTAIVVTNAGPATQLHINIVSGDEGDNWRAQNFNCNVTQDETVLFIFEWDGFEGSIGNWECSNLQLGGPPSQQDIPDPYARDQDFAAQNGVFVVTLQDPTTGETINADQIFGDATVIDFGSGAAYSMGAIAFQGASPTEPGVADAEYRFDNLEYSRWPSAVATNFVAPDAKITLELILFTLDGTTGQPQTPPAFVDIDFFNDDEVEHSSTLPFDCFIIQDMVELDGRFAESDLGSPVGHMRLTPKSVTYPNLAHDTAFDGGPGSIPGVRVPPVHGWVVQTISEGGKILDLPVGAANSNKAAWARTLAQSGMPITVSSGDTPVFVGRQ